MLKLIQIQHQAMKSYIRKRGRCILYIRMNYRILKVYYITISLTDSVLDLNADHCTYFRSLGLLPSTLRSTCFSAQQDRSTDLVRTRVCTFSCTCNIQQFIQVGCTFRCTVQYSTVQYCTVQYSTVQYSTVQYSTVQYSTVKFSTVQYSTCSKYIYKGTPTGYWTPPKPFSRLGAL